MTVYNLAIKYQAEDLRGGVTIIVLSSETMTNVCGKFMDTCGKVSWV